MAFKVFYREDIRNVCEGLGRSGCTVPEPFDSTLEGIVGYVAGYRAALDDVQVTMVGEGSSSARQLPAIPQNATEAEAYLMRQILTRFKVQQFSQSVNGSG